MVEPGIEPASKDQSSIAGFGRPGAWREGDGVRFHVFAPGHERVEVVLYKKDGVSELASLPMDREGDGHFRAFFDGATRLLYKFRVDGDGPFPDPASRAQPFGVHGPSEVSEARFAWSDGDWKGIPLEDVVLYEVHVGAATELGTFDALAERLPDLKSLGVTALELMPIASFPGCRNWGYDGVSLFAPQQSYGGPFGLRRLVDAAHRLGLAVILDVVYNHLGPDGNYLGAYFRDYMTDRRKTPWGEAVDIGRPEVRAFLFANAEMWIRDFHLDGLRLDATHALLDDESPAFLRELAERARAAGQGRHVLVIAEDDRNARHLVASPLRERGACGLDAVWSDDFHHEMRRALAGDHDGWYRDFQGTVEEIVATLQRGWLYQGQRSIHFGGPRGTRAAGLDPPQFVHFLQNHDQVGNRPLGDRLGKTVEPAACRAATTLLLLSPYTPLLFMGQEWGASTPFLYFTDHREPLGSAVREGRRAEFRDFAGFQGASVPDPQSVDTFDRSVLDWNERAEPAHAAMLALHRELLSLRARHPALRNRARDHVEVSALGESALVLARRGAGSGEVLVIVNLRGTLRHAPEGHYHRLLYSNEVRFGGSEESGAGFVEGEVRMEGAGAVVLEAER